MFKFIKTKDETNEFDQVDIEFTIKDSGIGKTDLEEYFRDFLRACGYCIKYEGDDE